MRKHQVKVERTPESIAAAIRYAEMELGDNFLEYRDIFADSSELMKFAHEKGYIDNAKHEFWKQGFNDNEQGAEETFEVVFGESPEFEPYCITYYIPTEDEDGHVVNDPDEYNRQYSKALIVYGELICSKEKYYNEFVAQLSSKEGCLEPLDVIVVQS